MQARLREVGVDAGLTLGGGQVLFRCSLSRRGAGRGSSGGRRRWDDRRGYGLLSSSRLAGGIDRTLRRRGPDQFAIIGLSVQNADPAAGEQHTQQNAELHGRTPIPITIPAIHHGKPRTCRVEAYYLLS